MGSKAIYHLSRTLNRAFGGYLRMSFQLLRHHQHALKWKLYSERVSRFMGIPYVMLNAPRWNTHALIASIGPVEIKERLILDLAPVGLACRSWTLVLYKQPANEAALILSPFSIDPSGQYPVEKGNYVILLRCYEVQYPFTLPGALIDIAGQVSERILPEKPAYYPAEVFNKSGRFYTLMHYYLHYAFAHPGLLEDKQLKKEYLPVGNPNTFFKFGYLPGNVRIQITTDARLRERALVYLTCFNRSSFPVLSKNLAAGSPVFESPLLAANGTYLIRVVPLDKTLSEDVVNDGICEVLLPDKIVNS
jgi:hypothetical protein